MGPSARARKKRSETQKTNLPPPHPTHSPRASAPSDGTPGFTNPLEALVKADTARSPLAAGRTPLGPALRVPTPPASASTRLPGVASLASLPSYPADFVRRRLLVFVSIVIGYACYYLTRNSLTYAAPVMVADAALGMDITQVRESGSVGVGSFFPP